MAEYTPSLCWQCNNTNRHKCSWFNPADPQPAPGWVAERRVRPLLGETYTVTECPNFVPEPPRKAASKSVRCRTPWRVSRNLGNGLAFPRAYY